MAYFTGADSYSNISVPTGYPYNETGKVIVKVGSYWYATYLDDGTPMVFKSSDFVSWDNINLPSPGASGYRGSNSTLVTDGTSVYYIDWIYNGTGVDVPCFSKYNGSSWETHYKDAEPVSDYYKYGLSANVLSNGDVYIVCIYKHTHATTEWLIYSTIYDGSWADWELLDPGWETNFTLDPIALAPNGSDIHVAVRLKSGSSYYVEYGKFATGVWGGFTEYDVTSYMTTLLSDMAVDSNGVVGVLLGDSSNLTLMKIATGSASYTTIMNGDCEGMQASLCTYLTEWHIVCPIGDTLKYVFTLSGVWQSVVTIYNNIGDSVSVFVASDNSEIGALCMKSDDSYVIGIKSTTGGGEPEGTPTSNPMFYKTGGTWHRCRRWKRCSK